MRRHAKATTAGSTQRQAKGLGRVFGGAFATRGVSLASKGSGAPSRGLRGRLIVLALASLAALLFAAGPASAATLPTVTAEAASEVGVSKAKLNGKINPHEVPNSYHFEWKQGTGASWEGANSSPPQSIEPSDNVEHAVSFNVTGLKGNTTYQARLVGVNTEESLSEFSAPVEFTTTKASAAPTATISGLSAITTTTAKVSGTVNPQGDPGTTWSVQLSTDPTCNTGFTTQATFNLESEATSPVPVEGEVTGLVSSQHYCAKIKAVNSAVQSEVQKLVVNAGEGEYTLSFEGQTTEPIAFKATAVTVRNRLRSLPAINSTSNIGVSGGPGNVGGTKPYTISFLGELGQKNVPQLVATSVSLSGGAATATVTTTVNGVSAGISSIQEFTTEPVVPSQVFTGFVAPRLDTSVRLNGYVNPQGANSYYPLTYDFEYSTDGGETWTALPDQEYTGEAREQIVFGEELTGLAPNTTYSYRFNAENAAGEASPQGEAKTFTTRSSAELVQSDRGIELVNNPDKGNQNVFAEADLGGAAVPITEDGDRVLWKVLGGAPGGMANFNNSFLAERGATGWSSRGLIPPPAEQVGEGNLGYLLEQSTPDFSHFVFGVGRNTMFGPVTQTFVRIDRNQHQEVLASYEKPFFAGLRGEISDDGTHVVLINPGNKQLEDVGGPAPEIVSVMPDGTPSECGMETEGAGDNISWAPEATSVNVLPGNRMMDAKDASRLYFEVKPNGDCGGAYALYERNRETEETFAIDTASGGSGPEFIRSTSDGRHAYFVTLSKLDPADTNSDEDVYRWDEESGESTCLTCVVADADVNSGFGYAVLVSDDFSHIYFQSVQELVPGMGTPGQVNTYVLEGGQIRFVAGPGVERWKQETPYLSADGNELLFKSSQGASVALSSDQLAEECFNPLNTAGKSPCAELYLYSDRDGSIECLSCDHEGETVWMSGSPSSGASADFKMSPDGSTVAFITEQPLLPEDVNGAADIYEWRNGAIHLITDGVTEFQTGQAAPQVRGISKDGSSVLFIVDSFGLTGFEQDGLTNMYAARIGGGFEVPPAPAHCSEESCQGAVEKAPSPPEASSAAFSGHGNLGPTAAKRCGKAKLRRGGRCLSRRAIAQQACRRKTGEAKRRCIEAHMRQTRQRRHLRIARAHHDSRRAK